jgi:LPXTG-site transpeptidase (sortase) family protein
MQKRGVVNEIARHPAAFATAFLVFFTLVFVFLSAVGATPNPVRSGASNGSPQHSEISTGVSSPESPVRVVAASIGLDTAVVNPTSLDVNVLDESLKNGAVRYPTSAQLGVDGTVLLFGHSSYLPVVYHQYYKTFDGIQNLKTGAQVSVYSSGTEYRYRVVGVKVANATDDVVELTAVGKHLTLVTCNSFADKSKRFVVTADFAGAYIIVSQGLTKALLGDSIEAIQ